MELFFTVEHFSAVQQEAAHLAAAHWQETDQAMYGAQAAPDTPPLDAAQYTALESAGMLHFTAARAVCGTLHGYAVFVLTPHIHMPGRVTASLTALYLTPAARSRPFTALRLLRFAEAGLHARRAFGVSYNSPHSRPCDALYRRLGARAVETIWYKEL